MTQSVEIDIAQTNLIELVEKLGPDDEVVLTKDHEPVARILPSRSGTPQFGRCKGMLTVVAEDDEHLADFEDYMP